MLGCKGVGGGRGCGRRIWRRGKGLSRLTLLRRLFRFISLEKLVFQ